MGTDEEVLEWRNCLIVYLSVKLRLLLLLLLFWRELVVVLLLWNEGCMTLQEHVQSSGRTEFVFVIQLLQTLD